MIKKIENILNSMLDNDYLFNENQKREHSNVRFMLIVVIAVNIFDGITSSVYSGSWEAALNTLLLILFTSVTLFIVFNIKNVQGARMVASLGIIGNILIQFATGAEFINFNTMLLYPVAVCYFLGNLYSVKYLPFLFGGILLFISFWGKDLKIPEDSNVYAHVVSGLICSCLLGFSIGYIHERSFQALIKFTDQVATSAHIDALTRMLTRRAFSERYAKPLEEQGLLGKPLFIIMCDIDFFKKVNDTYGHETGDDVLKHVSGILSKYAVGRDVCFRWGGEEFLMFLHERSMQKAIDAANRIRVVLEYTPFLSVTAGVIKVTMSFGLHQYDPSLSMEKNIAVADGYLYAAKHNGRNRVEHVEV